MEGFPSLPRGFSPSFEMGWRRRRRRGGAAFALSPVSLISCASPSSTLLLHRGRNLASIILSFLDGVCRLQLAACCPDCDGRYLAFKLLRDAVELPLRAVNAALVTAGAVVFVRTHAHEWVNPDFLARTLASVSDLDPSDLAVCGTKSDVPLSFRFHIRYSSSSSPPLSIDLPLLPLTLRRDISQLWNCNCSIV